MQRSRMPSVARQLLAEIPPPAKRKEFTNVHSAALLIQREGKVLLCQRPPTAERGAMLWEFPASEEVVGLKIELGPEVLTVRHGVTRFKITLVGMEATWLSGEFASEFYTAGVWLTPAELADYPMSTPQGKLRRAIGVGLTSSAS